ncbi:D-2-hydroxyacid dehydrogenase [Oleidesulfovibrio sp.]|uniref:D-2-hydroxyacid dehydrogenase n=1 Tax=Oleidesulfovibrio sp. TaxID=2909707 RepID=UPI003A89670A
MNITVLDGYTLNPGDNPWDKIQTFGKVITYDRTAPENILTRAQGADILLTNKARLTADIINALPELKFISVLATGYDVVDIAAAAGKKIPVSNVPGYGVEAVAQHTMALLLELCRRTAHHDSLVKQGVWTAAPDWCFWDGTQRELTGLTMGVIGFGNSGRRVAELANAFGMNILAYAPRPKAAPAYNNFRFCQLDELLAEADVVSLHCPLTSENKHLINAERIQTMKNGAIVLNTARGPLIDENALADALNAGKLGGAGLDVTEVEPLPADNTLMNAANCLITPHIAWSTLTARKRLMDITAENIRAFIKTAPQHVVNSHLM